MCALQTGNRKQHHALVFLLMKTYAIEIYTKLKYKVCQVKAKTFGRERQLRERQREEMIGERQLGERQLKETLIDGHRENQLGES